MKIGRNDPCPCGSGKKYKKCCMGKLAFEEINVPKDYFRLKGKRAEEIVQDLALKTFFTDWCYLNPILPNSRELCDLLVVFDEVAIIWQVKDLKLDRQGKYKRSEVEKNLRQLSGARRQLFELKTPIELENPRRGKELFNPREVKEIYLISVLLGEGEKFFSSLEDIKNYTVHVFTRDFIQIILNELDTISDFTDYLQKKEELFKKDRRLFILGGEEELLAFYIMNNRSFERLKKADLIFTEEGSWKHLQNKPEYKAKKKQDKISYVWDSIINRAHMTDSGAEKLEYEKVARELARPNRFQRRCLSKVYFDAHIQAHNDDTQDSFRRILFGDGVTYCFLFQDDPEPREQRKAMLAAICWIARGKYQQNKKVIGVATEKKIKPMCSYDFCLFDLPEWTEEYQRNMENLQKETGIFTDPIVRRVHEDEYPNTTEDLKND